MTDKQKAFVDEYLIDLNATQAAIRAGYSERTARQTGAENLSKPDIQAAIQQAQDARSGRTKVTADLVVLELARIAFSDVTHYVVGDGGHLGLTESADTLATRAVQSVKQRRKTYKQGKEDVEEIDTEIRLWSKTSALDMLGKHLGMFGPKGTEEDPMHLRFTGADFSGNEPPADS